MAKFVRQGDVLVSVDLDVKPVGELKKVERENGRVVLAHGEVTGHAHAIEDAECDLYVDTKGNLFLDVKKPVVLRHEEHKREHGNHKDGFPVVEKGVHPVRRQREYFPEQIRQVKD